MLLAFLFRYLAPLSRWCHFPCFQIGAFRAPMSLPFGMTLRVGKSLLPAHGDNRGRGVTAASASVLFLPLPIMLTLIPSLAASWLIALALVRRLDLAAGSGSRLRRPGHDSARSRALVQDPAIDGADGLWSGASGPALVDGGDDV